jgi:hypothetical protein
MSIEKSQAERQEKYPYNLLTNFDDTVEAMTQVEGESWINIDKRKRDTGKDLGNTVFGAVEKFHKMAIPGDNSGFVYDIYGSGGVSRWMVRADGSVEFSAHHDQVEPREKTQKARALGFKIFE